MLTGNYQGFEVSLDDVGVARITFNQPERLNGTTQPMKRDLVEVLLQAQMDDKVRVILFTGSGRAFCAGEDMSPSRPPYDESHALVPPIPRGHGTGPIGTYEGLRAISQPVQVMVRFVDKLSIAAINGLAIQSGLSLALACDFRIASTEARLGSATLRFGLLPDEGGHYLLIQHLGIAKAMDFLMRKRIVTATEALELGLVGEVVPPDELRARATELANELATGPQVAMRLLKRAIYNAAEMTFEQSLEDIAIRTGISDNHPDSREGTAAFREKRAPKFS
ncbi:MAG TPA: enoyl-CoA hydratase-related protein [Dehalococcoidia bacterium]